MRFKRLGMEPSECFIDCDSPKIQESFEKYPWLEKPIRAMCERGPIDDEWYCGICQEELSRKYGFGRANWIKFIDLLVLVADNVWVVEVKPKLNYEALGQALVYKDYL